jgi:hypothetical protein
VACRSEPPPCSLYIDQVYPGPTDHLQIVQPGMLLAWSYDAIEWHPLAADGTVGPASRRMPEALEPAVVWLDFLHLSIPRGNGLRLITDHRAAYVDPGSPSRAVRLAAASPAIPEDFHVERAWNVDGVLYCVWSAVESGFPVDRSIAGLGRIGDDDAVIALGEPFYRGSAPTGIPGLRFFGGWDPDGYFWIDCPGGQQVFQVAPDGTLLGTFDIAGHGPYLLNWVKLPSGRWAGQQGSLWGLFTPLDRTTPTIHAVPASGTTTSTTQSLDADGQLWIAGPADGEVVVRRWDDATSTMGPEQRSPLAVGHCDSPIYLR